MRRRRNVDFIGLGERRAPRQQFIAALDVVELHHRLVVRGVEVEPLVLVHAEAEADAPVNGKKHIGVDAEIEPGNAKVKPCRRLHPIGVANHEIKLPECIRQAEPAGLDIIPVHHPITVDILEITKLTKAELLDRAISRGTEHIEQCVGDDLVGRAARGAEIQAERRQHIGAEAGNKLRRRLQCLADKRQTGIQHLRIERILKGEQQHIQTVNQDCRITQHAQRRKRNQAAEGRHLRERHLVKQSIHRLHVKGEQIVARAANGRGRAGEESGQ